ncbi:MAG: aminotransferase class I/II-fold pyridoxal phosphate-dependent enzyme [Actinomycetota bacterium]|jgi:cysteine-S-conjugate beta-lyase|nr:aminotransferase class I/II-fold pyridoxal phosphate-dependent enzyme [Actinomycetota bacterium]
MGTPDELLTVSEERVRGRLGAKWSKHGPDVLAAWVADMDFDPPASVLDAIRAHTERGDLGYGPFAVDLAPGYADWQERRHGWRPDIEQIHPFTSALHALEVALWNTTDPGDGVVVFTPVYYPFLDAIDNSGRRRIEVPLITDGWKLDVERFEAAIDDTTKIILFCNPHNPTGRIFDADERAAVAEIAERHDLLVITDEIWGDLTHQVGFTPLGATDERFAGRLVTLGSASKTFNLAGLRTAVAHIDHAPLAATLATMPGHLQGSPSTLGITGTITAWTACDDWLTAARRTIEARRNQLATRLAADLPDVGFQLPQATYLGWLDFSAYDIGDDPSDWLLEHAQVALSSGAKFGTGGLGCARINVATSSEILDRVIDRIAATLSTHRHNHSGSTA